MSMISKKKVLSVAIGTALAVPSIPVLAQAELEEIVVTARKREESIMKVPVTSTVLGGDEIEQYAQSSLQGMKDRIPGLNLGQGDLAAGTQVTLRGIGTSTINSVLDQSVALNVDGMQMTQGLAYGAAMFDMQQVEVHKGPQALFYGKAAPGGVISVQTANPGDEFEAILRHGYEFNAEEHRTDLILSGPVTDTLGLRLATRYSDSEGWMSNEATAWQGLDSGAVTPGDDTFGAEENWLVRGTAVWEPTTDFSAEFKVTTQSSETEGSGGEKQLASCPDGAAPSPNGIPFIHPDEDCDLDDTNRIVHLDPADFGGNLPNGGVPYSEFDQTFGTLELDYQLTPDLNLTSVTGYYDVEQEQLLNTGQSGHAAGMLASYPSFERDDFTQEVRLTSSFADSPVNFTVGAFYQDGDMTYSNNTVTNRVFLSGVLPGVFSRGSTTIGTEARSVFGQLIWNLTPTLEISGGVRWTDEERTLDVVNRATNPPTDPAAAERNTPDISEKNWSPELSVTYTPTNDLTVYGNLKKAYKAGSFETGRPQRAQDISFGEETVTGGDVGIKTQLLDRALRLNAATYYYVYDDMQVGANKPNQISNVTLNAAESEIYGAEFDMTYNPADIEGLTLNAALNYNIAEYEEFTNANCWGGQLQSEGCIPIRDGAGNIIGGRQDLSGEKLVRAPEWTGNIGADYAMPLGGGKTLTLGWYTSYSSKYLTNLVARDDMWQDNYFTHNATVTLAGARDSWKISLIGNNITDEIVAGSCLNASVQTGILPSGLNTAGTQPGAAGSEELTCDVSNRRSVWLRFEMKLDNFLGG